MDNKIPKAFYMNLKKNISKAGAPFYTGKFAYAIDIIAFEKKDGSGDLTVWLQPKDMDQMKEFNNKVQGQPYQKKEYIRPQAVPQAPPPPKNYAPPSMVDDDEPELDF